MKKVMLLILGLLYGFLFISGTHASSEANYGGYFTPSSNGVQFAGKLIEGSDTQSFRYAQLESGEISNFGHDAEKYYFREKTIGKATEYKKALTPVCIEHVSSFFSCFTRNPKTKTITTHTKGITGNLSSHGDYLFDDKKIYYITNSKFTLLDHDPAEIEFLNEYYFKNGNNLYFGTIKIHAAHARSFSVYQGYGNEKFAKDKKYVYHSGRIIPNTTSRVFNIENFRKQGTIAYGIPMTDTDIYMAFKSFPRAAPYLLWYEQISYGNYEHFLGGLFGFYSHGAAYSFGDIGSWISELLESFKSGWIYLIIIMHVLFHRCLVEREYIYFFQSLAGCAGAILGVHFLFQFAYLFGGIVFGIGLQYFLSNAIIYLITKFILGSNRSIAIWFGVFPFLNFAFYTISVTIYVTIRLFLL